MNLRGQDGIGKAARGERGYAMAALLVTLAVMGVLLTAAMPVWKTAARREKEAELVFRGEQYARAIMLFQRRVANAAPPNIDMLVEQRFLRKKYKDPITDDDFALILAGQNTTPGAQQAADAAGRGAAPTASSQGGGSMTISAGIGNAGGAGTGGIVGVTSKSTEESLRLYNGRNHYNEWVFTPTQQTQAPGAAPGGQPGVVPGVGGPPGGGVGQRGNPGRGGGPGDGGRGRGFGPTGPRRGGLPQTPSQPPQG